MYLNEVIMKKSKAYQPELIESLRNPRESEKYLNVALEEDDPELFLLALRKCDGSTRRCSAACRENEKLNRESIYKMLSERGILNSRASMCYCTRWVFGWPSRPIDEQASLLPETEMLPY